MVSPQLLPGGEYIRVNVVTAKGLSDMRVIALNLRTGEKKTVLEATGDARFSRDNPQFSPDGKWVAFQSNQAGANEIFVVPYPGPGGIMQISSGGGTDPRWNHNGRELFFRNGNKVMAVGVEGGSTFQASTPHELFDKASPSYDVSPDGRRFLMLKPVPSGSGSASHPDGVHLIVNWFDELRRKVPVP